MKDFWAFRTMVTPIIIKIIFWFGVIVCIVVGLVYLGSSFSAQYGGMENLLKGVLILLFGPLAVRVYCEILIVFFRINETLTEIKHVLDERPPPPLRPAA